MTIQSISQHDRQSTAQEASDSHREILSIQYLRFIAAISVVIFHVFGNSLMGFGRFFSHGVDLFFVISGFLMMALTYDNRLKPKDFLVGRLVRICPTYWIATVIWLICLQLNIIAGYSQNTDLRHFIYSVLFIPSLSINGYLPTLYLGWTLNYEMFFYLIFTLSIFCSRLFRLEITATIFVLLFVIGILARPFDSAIDFYTNPMILEFLAGSTVGSAFGMDLRRNGRRRCVSVTLSTALALACAAAFDHRLIWGVVSVLLLGLALMYERQITLPRVDFLILLGNASFSIYLFQDFGFHIAGFLGQNFGHLLEDENLRLRIIALSRCLAAVGIGLTAHKFIERPVTQFVRQKLRSSNAKE